MKSQEMKQEQSKLKRISGGLTIEERANTFRDGSTDTYTKNIRKMYIVGAEDQLEIDIQRAREWLDEYFDRCFGVSAWQFCESAKIEITKAMKGE